MWLRMPVCLRSTACVFSALGFIRRRSHLFLRPLTAAAQLHTQTNGSFSRALKPINAPEVTGVKSGFWSDVGASTRNMSSSSMSHRMVWVDLEVSDRSGDDLLIRNRC